MSDILKRDLAGELISVEDPDYNELQEAFNRALRLAAELNTVYHTEDEIREILTRLTGEKIDPTTSICQPFYTDIGLNIKFGKNVFINVACTFLSRGGITIEDDVMLAPNVCLVTTNHSIDPYKRKSTVSKPICICKNAWIGTAAIILPGVTVGKNAVVAAGAVVTKDVPENAVVAGNPAKVIEVINEIKKSK